MMERTSHPIGVCASDAMGVAIAKRLRDQGFDVVATATAKGRDSGLASAGVRVVTETRAVFEACGRVILSLTDDTQTTRALADVAPRTGTIVIDVHIGDPAFMEWIARDLASKDIQYVDAPFAASDRAIARGDAVVMIGGHPETIAACDDIWAALARERFLLGAAGAGQRARLVVELVLALNRTALAEGLALAEALGIPGATFVDLVRATPAYSRAADSEGNRMLSGDFKGGARLAQQSNLVALIMDVGRRARRGLPMTRAQAHLIELAVAAGEGDLDVAAIVETLRRAPPDH